MTVIEREIKYAWLDEDGQRVSPIHASFGAAIKFIADWHENYMRLSRLVQTELEQVSAVEQVGGPGSNYESQRCRDRAERAQKALDKLTLTGNQPIELKRWVVTTTLEDITDEEDSVAASVIRSGVATAEAQYGTRS